MGLDCQLYPLNSSFYILYGSAFVLFVWLGVYYFDDGFRWYALVSQGRVYGFLASLLDRPLNFKGSYCMGSPIVEVIDTRQCCRTTRLYSQLQKYDRVSRIRL